MWQREREREEWKETNRDRERRKKVDGRKWGKEEELCFGTFFHLKYRHFFATFFLPLCPPFILSINISLSFRDFERGRNRERGRELHLLNFSLILLFYSHRDLLFRFKTFYLSLPSTFCVFLTSKNYLSFFALFFTWTANVFSLHISPHFLSPSSSFSPSSSPSLYSLILRENDSLPPSFWLANKARVMREWRRKEEIVSREREASGL